ncbi:MAG: tetratricopeptide repeat protein [Planctomycetota bacterium]
MHRRLPFVSAAALLVLMTLAAYWPATSCGYIWDDDDYVHQNVLLRSTGGLGEIWLDVGATPQYYPLVHTSYWLEYRLWEDDPRGYHVVNILLHALGAVLLWRVLKRLGVPGAWVAAAVFALHPVHVESVAWITERKNVLSGVFYLGSALLYLRFTLRTGEDRPSRWLYAGALALFVCALLSKTVACSLPAALLLVLWWKRGHIGWQDARLLAPFFALGVAFGLLTIWMEVHRVGAEGATWNLTFIDRCLIAGRALGFYAGKLIWPWPLMFVYPRWQINASAWWQYTFPAAAAAVVVGLWLARNRIGRGPLVAVLFFAGTLVPALGFFDIYPMRYSFVADHFQYLASIGLIALGATGLFAAARRCGDLGLVSAGIAAGVVLLVLGTATWRYGHAFQDAEMLWRDTLDNNDNAWIAHNNLGTILQARGRQDEAFHHFRRAVEINPDHAEAHNNVGGILGLQGRADEAIIHFRRALELDPGLARAHANLGNALLAQSRLDEAMIHFREAERLDPALSDVIRQRLEVYEETQVRE